MKKKLLSLLLAVVMVTSLVACGEKKGGNAPTPGGEATGETNDGGEVDPNATYTWHDTIASVNTFSPTDWQLSDESAVMGPAMSGLYEFVIDLEAEGEYSIIPEMAEGAPQDVTSEFAGNETYGVPADAANGYAWRIKLRKDLTWDDGTKITTHDYEYSLQQFLNPDMKNYRASSFYDGQGAIANALGYYEGSVVGAASKGKTMADLTAGADGVFTIDGTKALIGWTTTSSYMGGSSLAEYSTREDWPEMLEVAPTLEALVDGNGYIEVTQDVLDTLLQATSADFWGNETYDDLINYIYFDDSANAITWDKVGFIADDDYTMTIILAHPVTEFYFYYNVGGGLSLVKEDLYEACKQDTGGLIKSTYGTAADKFASYGPYKVTEYQEGKYVRLEKNENWFGYHDGQHEGLYQTTAIDLQMISEHTTSLNLFLQGKLDAEGLTSDDIPDYGTSDFVVYTPQTYTASFCFNTSFDALKAREDDGINKTIMTYIDFRKALSLSLDRADYCKTCTSGYSPAFGLINDMYVYNPEVMASYRASDEAKKGLCETYDVSDVSELSGYNVEEASKLLQSAYDACYKDGNIKDNDKVVIEYHIYGSDNTYQKQVDFVQKSLLAAAVGTSLEDRIEVKLVEDQDYYNSMKRGENDFIRENWGGAAMDPYGLVQVYTDPSYSNEYGMDLNEKCTINVQGQDITKGYTEWYKELNNGEYAAADYSVKNEILAGLEKNLLLHYQIIPVASYRSAALYSQRVILPTDHFINVLVERGTYYRDYKYTMNDAEWEEYCASQNNQLSY